MILRKMRLRQKKKKKWFPYEKNVYKSPDEKTSIFKELSLRSLRVHNRRLHIIFISSI